MHRRAPVLFLTLFLLPAAAPPPYETHDQTVITFRLGNVTEVYDRRHAVMHMGSHSGAMISDCSNSRFHCMAAINALIAPRDCRTAQNLLRAGATWKISDRLSARLIFRVPRGAYYFAVPDARGVPGSEAGSRGFAYDLRRGIVGTWYSREPVARQATKAQIAGIVSGTRTIVGSETLFACRKVGA